MRKYYVFEPEPMVDHLMGELHGPFDSAAAAKRAIVKPLEDDFKSMNDETKGEMAGHTEKYQILELAAEFEVEYVINTQIKVTE